MDTGHWIFNKEFDIDEWFGFVYRIIELDTGREYVGKKQFHEYRRKAVKGRKNKIKIKKESDWKLYTGSSTELNIAINETGIQNYKFIIESLHKTRGSLYYAEVHTQITEDVLRVKLEDGVTKKYFNKQVAGVKFIPPTECAEETKMKISHSLKKRYNHEPHWRSVLSDEEIIEINALYYAGKNHYLHRLMTEEERTKWIADNMIGKANPMYGKEPNSKGKTFEEIYGYDKAIEIKTMISAKSGRVREQNGMYGKTHSDEQKEKWRNDPRRRKVGSENGMFGKPCYYAMDEEKKDEWKANISKSTRGKPKSKDHATKIGLAHKGKKKASHTCPYCNFTGRGGNMKRYHFDNCKHRPTIN